MTRQLLRLQTEQWILAVIEKWLNFLVSYSAFPVIRRGRRIAELLQWAEKWTTFVVRANSRSRTVSCRGYKLTSTLPLKNITYSIILKHFTRYFFLVPEHRAVPCRITDLFLKMRGCGWYPRTPHLLMFRGAKKTCFRSNRKWRVTRTIAASCFWMRTVSIKVVWHSFVVAWCPRAGWCRLILFVCNVLGLQISQ